jgi:hypothetical protein
VNVFIESWDYLDTTSQRFFITGSETPKTIAGGRRSTLCCAADTEDGFGRYLVASSGNTLICGAAVAWPTSSGLGKIFSIGDETASGYTNVFISAQDDGSLGVYGHENTLLALSPAGVLQFGGAYQYIEMKVLVASGVAGSVQVRVNGQPVITLNAVQTYYSGALVPTVVSIYPQGRRTYDDLYVNTDAGLQNFDFAGDVRIDTHYPDAAGDFSEWNRNTGSTQFGTIDEHPPDEDVTYNFTQSAEATDALGLQDLIPVLAGVRAVHLLVRPKRVVAIPASGNMRSLLRIGGTNYFGAPYLTSTSGYQYFPTIFETSPATASEFSDAEFDDMQVGYQRVL